eukprot:1159758-Pelagomonas_calceolata.AAC.4
MARWRKEPAGKVRQHAMLVSKPSKQGSSFRFRSAGAHFFVYQTDFGIYLFTSKSSDSYLRQF